MTQAEQDVPIRGVFSSQEIRKVGTGTTTRKTVQKIFWFVEQDGNTLSMQSINMKFIPTGKKRIIEREELLEKYAPEPEFYLQSVYPQMQAIQDGSDRGDTCRKQGKNFSAEFEYETVLALDEGNVRANFGIALTYLARGETDKADNIFGRLVKLDATYEPEHKHLFNEFGMNLRKNAMLVQAIDYYGRALSLSQKDDNLHVNMARALFENSQIGPCIDHLLHAMTINHENVVGRKFLEWLITNKRIPADMLKDVNDVLAGGEYSKPLEAILGETAATNSEAQASS